MLDRSNRHTFAKINRREAGDYVVALAFFGAVGIAMIAWLAAIAWISWHLIKWMFS